MIGVFDSGVGGLTALRELKTLLPHEDFVYLSDTKNCPYGTKRREELLPIVKRNVSLLRECGADIILSACCTASTLYHDLSSEEMSVTVPIIHPAARAATETVGIAAPRITVIATEYTARAGAFTSAIKERCQAARVTEMPTQRLVELVEGGLRDGDIDRVGRKYLTELSARIRSTEPDVLILGCTHFSHLERTLGTMLHGVRIVSPAREGALALTRIYKYRKSTSRPRGRLTYIGT